jgi:integrase
MLTIKLRYILQDTDRHGNVRIYFRKRGQPMVRLRESLGSAEFMAHYQRCMRGESEEQTHARLPASKPSPGSFRALCIEYFSSVDFTQLDVTTQGRRRRIFDEMFAEPIAPNSNRLFGDMPISDLTSKAVRVLRDRKATTPESANMRLKALRGIFKWALKVECKDVKSNPVRDIEKLKSFSDGFYAWTVDDVAQYEKRHAIGTKARLAESLMLFTGVRRSDVVRLGKQHVKDGWLHFTAFKGRRRSPSRLSLPILPELQRIIDRSPCGDLTFLVNDYGKPFTAKGFGNRMKKWCLEADLPECSSHGLRKVGATIAAENGATDHQLMAIFGWKSIAEAQRYTKKARQERLAGSGMHLLRRRKEKQK